VTIHPRLVHCLLAGLLVLCGCTSLRGAATEPAAIDNAAAEATAIVQRAEATAMVLRAQAQATRLIQNALSPTSTPALTEPSPTPQSMPVPTTGLEAPNPTPVISHPGTPTEDESAVQLLGVSLGTESDLVLVQFKAPPAVTRQWQQTNVYLVDEATGTVYNEVSVAPVVGPLFARPKRAGQIGYVMFVNPGSSLRQGARVTVVLGNFKQEHVTVT
jgi:hypothetical protein